MTIPGNLRGKQRARVSTRGGFARAYTPAETVNAEAHVKQCCIAQLGQPCLEGPLSVKLGIGVGIPVSWSKKKRDAALAGDIRPVGRPDASNCLKLVEDALNGVLWRDDSQIVEVSVRKSYAHTPVTVLTVEAV